MNLGDDHPVEEVVKAHVLGVLRRHKFNLTAAAKILGPTRQTIWNWLKRWGLSRGIIDDTPPDSDPPKK